MVDLYLGLLTFSVIPALPRRPSPAVFDGVDPQQGREEERIKGRGGPDGRSCLRPWVDHHSVGRHFPQMAYLDFRYIFPYKGAGTLTHAPSLWGGYIDPAPCG